MAFFNRADLTTFLGFLVAVAVPACGSTESNGPSRDGSSGSAGSGEMEGAGKSGKGGSGGSDAGRGGSSGGDAHSGTSAGGTAGANGGASGAGGSASSGNGNVTDLAGTYCKALRSCCQDAGFGSGDQLADCESEYPETYGYGLDFVAAGTVLVDQAALDTCLDTLRQLATSCVGVPYNTCQKALKGTRATGESCTSLTECKTGTEPVACMLLGSDTSGKCQPIPRGTLNATCGGDCFAGGSCSFTSVGGTNPMPLALCFSEDNLFCDITLDLPTCKSTNAMGTECGSDWQCGADGYCDYDADPVICNRRKSVGQPCHFSSECSKRDELYCDGSHCALQPFVSDSECGGTSF